MVTVTVMAITKIAIINPCLFYDSNGTMAAIISFSFYIWWKCTREFVGDKGNRRGEGNRGLVYYYEDGDGNGNGNGNCLSKKGGWSRGEEGEWKDGFIFIHCIHFWWRGGRLFHAVLFSYCFLCLSLFNSGWLILYQVQVNCWTFISCKISLPVKIWSSHFCLATKCESQLWPIAVRDIGTRQGCELFKVAPPHLILVAQICVCIIIGNLDRVIDALRQVDWFDIKFKSIVGHLSLARFLFQSKVGHHISVWQQSVRVNCGQ